MIGTADLELVRIGDRPNQAAQRVHRKLGDLERAQSRPVQLQAS
jgi:hypothetical protein